MLRKTVLIILVVGSFCINGCASRTVLMPRLSGAALEEAQKQDFFSQLKERDAAIKTGKVLFTTQIAGRGERTTVKQAVLFEKPEKLRIETFPLNQSIALSLFVTDGKKTTFIDHTSGERVVNVSAADILRSFLHLPMDHKDFISFLYGAIPEHLIARNPTVIEDQSRAQILMIFKDSASWWLIEGTTNRVLEAAINEQFQQSTVLHFKYEWQDIKSEFPSSIQLKVNGDLSINLKTRTVQMNSIILEPNWDQN